MKYEAAMILAFTETVISAAGFVYFVMAIRLFCSVFNESVITLKQGLFVSIIMFVSLTSLLMISANTNTTVCCINL